MVKEEKIKQQSPSESQKYFTNDNIDNTLESQNYVKKVNKYKKYIIENSKDNLVSNEKNYISNFGEKLDTSKIKSRKNSKDTEGYSTSNEEHNEKIKAKRNKKIGKKVNKFTKESKRNKEPYKTNAFDFKKKYKTELCKYFEINGYCKYGDYCAYAHGKENLRLKVTNTSAYRTKKCVQFFENGYCPYGGRCQFAHQLESNIINNPYDKKMTYTKIMEILSKIDNIKNIENIIEKPRLQVFENLVKNENNIPSRLLNDIKNIDIENIYY